MKPGRTAAWAIAAVAHTGPGRLLRDQFREQQSGQPR